MFSSGVYTAQTLHLGLNDFKEGGGDFYTGHGSNLVVRNMEIFVNLV